MMPHRTPTRPPRILPLLAILLPLLLAGLVPAAPAAEPTPAPSSGPGTLALTNAAPLSPLAAYRWTYGPAKADLKTVAELAVPEGFMFCGGKDTRSFLELLGNPTSGSELGLLAPTNFAWFVVFRFDDVGYVKDDDKDKLDPAQLLTTIRDGTEQANKIREKMGAPSLRIVGWEFPPRYNERTHNLEWAIRGESEGEPVVNYNTRILGRKGVMEVKLVLEPDELPAALPAYQKLLADYSFKPGEGYAEYREGDKLAKYGLAALVTGVAAAAAVKTGLFAALVLFFKKAWKLVVIGVIACAGFFKKLIFGADRRRTTAESPGSTPGNPTANG